MIAHGSHDIKQGQGHILVSFGMEELLFDISLIPRHQHSRTFKLCRCGEPGTCTFSHMSTVKGREEIERP